MSSTRKLLFHAIMWLLVLGIINLGCLVAVRMLSGVNPLDRSAYLEYKARFVKTVDRTTYAHPYFGQAFTGHAPVDGLVSNGEPVLFAVPEALPADPVKVLIIGGSVASHFSLNRADDRFQDNGVDYDREDIFERALRAEFGSDRFVVYNGAMPGGKQPQQLFKLYYLDLLGQSWDIVINLDGFNEVALPLAENIPLGNHPIFPRSYSQLLRSSGVDSRCVATNNRFTESYSLVPMVELAKLLYIRRCVQALEGTGDEDALDLAGLSHFTAKDDDASFAEAEAIWQRASRASEAFARQKGFDYLHVLQPNQYLDGAKALSAEEREKFLGYPTYGNPIRQYYGRLDLASTGAGHTLDLRYLFKDETRTLYRDECCHFTNQGQLYLAQAIIRGKRELFEARLQAKPATGAAANAAPSPLLPGPGR